VESGTAFGLVSHELPSLTTLIDAEIMALQLFKLNLLLGFSGNPSVMAAAIFCS